MSIEESLYKFINELIAETGESDPLIKIGIHPKVYNQLTYELYQKHGYSMAHQSGELVFMGVQILPRTKDSF